jgi:hypothetical protein
MPKIERYVSIRFQDKPYDFHNCESSDLAAESAGEYNIQANHRLSGLSLAGKIGGG